jgi:biotin operon repressor
LKTTKYILGSLSKTQSYSERCDFVNFLKLKTINSQGVISDGNRIKAVKEHLGCSSGSVTTILKKIEKRGWGQYIPGLGFKLISYDDFFSKYGYSFKPKKHKNHKFRVKGCFNGKILKVTCDPKDLLTNIIQIELRQTAYLMNFCIDGETQNKQSTSSYSSEFSASYIASLLGCKSRLTGVKQIKKLKSIGTEVKRNKSKLVKKGISKAKGKFLPRSQFWFKGSVLEYRANSFFFYSYPMYTISDKISSSLKEDSIFLIK